MYDIRQFRPTLFTVVILGMTGFAWASQSPVTWVIAIALVMLNFWLVRTERYKPLPRYLANTLTLILLAIGARDVLLVGSGGAVLAIGRFLVFVQIIKLFEIRANRDYAQLLVLSLLLMVAASISTASLLFGIMLLCYLFISLYSCLLFHLKVESDMAKATLADSQQEVSSATLRQDQRWLSRSMRKLTGLVASVSITSAVLVFIFCPRGSGGMMAGFQFRGSQALVGISDSVQFQDVAKISQSDEKVAEVHVWRNNAPVNGTETILLRGSTFDVYTGNGSSGSAPWLWRRSFPSDGPTPVEKGHEIVNEDAFNVGDNIVQTIRLQPTGTHALFSMAGAYRFEPLIAKKFDQFIFNRRDQTLHTFDVIYQPIEYKVTSNGVLTGDPTYEPLHVLPREGDRLLPTHSVIDPKIADFAKRPEVSGSDNQGPLAARRGANTRVSALDEAIARNIEHYLQSQFAYTLDLSDARKIMRGQDPVVAFLYDLKRGHCEYFAGAMTLMCQSLGMQARLVVGFKCDEFNTFDGGYYQVRQSHAHAWVEVLVPDPSDPNPQKGIWKTFDPTSGREDGTRIVTAWMRTRHFLDFLEYKWANSVIGYDGALSESVGASAMTRFVNAAERTQFAATDLHKFLDGASFMSLSSSIIAIVIGLMVVAIFIFTIYFLYDRWRLRRRAARIGLDSLSPADQLRFARQLGFYAELMRLLERRRIVRPRHQTPLEFSASLTFLSNEAYSTVHRLTRIFYRIRFGDRPLTPGQHRLLANTLARLATSLRV